MLFLKTQKLVPHARLPAKAHDTDWGFDLWASETVTIPPGGRALVGTGLAIAVPEGYGALIRDRSGMANKGAIVSGGVIDEGYAGEWKVIITNFSCLPLTLEPGGKAIAQFLILPNPTCKVVEVASLEETERGAGGFGSSDKVQQ